MAKVCLLATVRNSDGSQVEAVAVIDVDLNWAPLELGQLAEKNALPVKFHQIDVSTDRGSVMRPFDLVKQEKAA